jgi:hypothetical protein
MAEHGDYNENLRKWYCSYWLTAKEWEDIHDYVPSSFLDATIDKNDYDDHPQDGLRESHKENRNN